MDNPLIWGAILGALGLGTIIGFVGKIWYNTERFKELQIEHKEAIADHERRIKDLYNMRHQDTLKMQEGFSEIKLLISELKGSIKNGTYGS